MREKSCENCYWYHNGTSVCDIDLIKHLLGDDDLNSKGYCKVHKFTCDCCESDVAAYEVEGEYLCIDCTLKRLDVESCEVTEYFRDGEYLGNSDEFRDVEYQLGLKPIDDV